MLEPQLVRDVLKRDNPEIANLPQGESPLR
jgi:hypothetical protein